MERIRELRALDVGSLDLSGLPPARIAALARHAATARAGDLAQLAPERRAATLMAFAYVGETRATDEALEMFYELLRALTARVQRRARPSGWDPGLTRCRRLGAARRRGGAARPRRPRRQGPSVGIPAGRAGGAGGAVADCERLIRPPEDYFEAALLSRYAMVRQFLPSLLATTEFEASPAGQPVLDALAALRSLEGRKKVIVDEVPAEVVSPAWRRLVGESGGPLDRRRTPSPCSIACDRRCVPVTCSCPAASGGRTPAPSCSEAPPGRRPGRSCAARSGSLPAQSAAALPKLAA